MRARSGQTVCAPRQSDAHSRRQQARSADPRHAGADRSVQPRANEFMPRTRRQAQVRFALKGFLIVNAHRSVSNGAWRKVLPARTGIFFGFNENIARVSVQAGVSKSS